MRNCIATPGKVRNAYPTRLAGPGSAGVLAGPESAGVLAGSLQAPAFGRAVLPLMVLFLTLQKYYIAGLLLGSVKE